MYLVLKELGSGCEVVDTWEAWLTLIFFFVLISMAFAADKMNGYLEDKKKSLADKTEEER
jgi:hypothetical protein